MKYGKLITFLGGVLMGTAGVSVLSSKDAKKVYTQVTAAVLRGKDCVMQTVATVKENCGDIYADAQDINEMRYEEAKAEELERAKAIVDAYASEAEDDFCESVE